MQVRWVAISKAADPVSRKAVEMGPECRGGISVEAREQGAQKEPGNGREPRCAAAGAKSEPLRSKLIRRDSPQRQEEGATKNRKRQIRKQRLNDRLKLAELDREFWQCRDRESGRSEKQGTQLGRSTQRGEDTKEAGENASQL